MTKKKWHQIYWLDFLWVHPATVRQSYYYDYCYVLAAAGVAAACEAVQWCFKPHFIWLRNTRIIVNCTIVQPHMLLPTLLQQAHSNSSSSKTVGW